MSVTLFQTTLRRSLYDTLGAPLSARPRRRCSPPLLATHTLGSSVHTNGIFFPPLSEAPRPYHNWPKMRASIARFSRLSRTHVALARLPPLSRQLSNMKVQKVGEGKRKRERLHLHLFAFFRGKKRIFN